MANYPAHINELIETGIVKDDEIFDFDDSPYSEEFQKVFDFYSDTLKLNSNYGIAPSYLYFHDDWSVNAKATRSNDKYVVGINSGTIIHLMQKHEASETVIFDEIELIKDYLGTEPNRLMYQFSIHFTFYHEMAHLIQKSNELEKSIIEMNGSSKPYDEKRHLLELDADNYASLCLAAHILDLFHTNFKGAYDLEKFSALVKITCAVGISYVLSFGGKEQEFYLRQSIHPHRSIRMFCVLHHILEYYQLNFGKENFPDELKKQLKRESLDMSAKLFGSEPIEKYVEDIKNNMHDILEYLSYFYNLEKNDKTLSVYKWNQMAAKLSK